MNLETLSQLNTVNRTQYEQVRDVMVSASECGTWLSLPELSRLLHIGESSVSAYLRQLRADGHQVKKQWRNLGPRAAHLNHWEYILAEKGN